MAASAGLAARQKHLQRKLEKYLSLLANKHLFQTVMSLTSRKKRIVFWLYSCGPSRGESNFCVYTVPLKLNFL